ncbi:MAG: hypothetical protein HOP29_18665 [Phycisphaerales bacterium]|nr:hypothetical protein [Phycisphaerales bacterium]
MQTDFRNNSFTRMRTLAVSPAAMAWLLMLFLARMSAAQNDPDDRKIRGFYLNLKETDAVTGLDCDDPTPECTNVGHGCAVMPLDVLGVTDVLATGTGIAANEQYELDADDVDAIEGMIQAIRARRQVVPEADLHLWVVPKWSFDRACDPPYGVDLGQFIASQGHPNDEAGYNALFGGNEFVDARGFTFDSTPCPLWPEYWEFMIDRRARALAELSLSNPELDGVMFDMELYPSRIDIERHFDECEDDGCGYAGSECVAQVCAAITPGYPPAGIAMQYAPETCRCGDNGTQDCCGPTSCQGPAYNSHLCMCEKNDQEQYVIRIREDPGDVSEYPSECYCESCAEAFRAYMCCLSDVSVPEHFNIDVLTGVRLWDGESSENRVCPDVMNLVAEYRGFQAERARQLAAATRRAVDAINPNFKLGAANGDALIDLGEDPAAVFGQPVPFYIGINRGFGSSHSPFYMFPEGYYATAFRRYNSAAFPGSVHGQISVGSYQRIWNDCNAQGTDCPLVDKIKIVIGFYPDRLKVQAKDTSPGDNPGDKLVPIKQKVIADQFLASQVYLDGGWMYWGNPYTYGRENCDPCHGQAVGADCVCSFVDEDHDGLTDERGCRQFCPYVKKCVSTCNASAPGVCSANPAATCGPSLTPCFERACCPSSECDMPLENISLCYFANEIKRGFEGVSPYFDRATDIDICVPDPNGPINPPQSLVYPCYCGATYTVGCLCDFATTSEGVFEIETTLAAPLGRMVVAGNSPCHPTQANGYSAPNEPGCMSDNDCEIPVFTCLKKDCVSSHCQTVVNPNGTPCQCMNDGDCPIPLPHCLGGVCVACAPTADCDDNPCTTTPCNDGVCGEPVPVEAPTLCDNGVFCDGTEECSAGVCQSSSPPCDTSAGEVCIESDSTHCQPTVLYVDSNLAAPGDGSSWAEALVTLRDAIELVGPNGTRPYVREIRVAGGTYRPDDTSGPLPQHDRGRSFALPAHVTVRGGYAGTAGNPGNPVRHDPVLYQTILSGDAYGDDNVLSFANNDENHYHVVTTAPESDGAILDSFIIQGGNADAASGDNQLGAGVLLKGGNPTITHCVLRFNSAGAGCGVAVVEGYGRIISSFIVRNRSTDGDGAVYIRNANPDIRHCTIVDNEGGGIDRTDCPIAPCPADIDAIVTHSIVWGNGSGEQIRQGRGTITVSYCDVGGGVTANGTCDNSIIWKVGNVDVDPMFVDASLGLYGLTALSQNVLDSGDPNFVPGPGETDLEGDPRVAFGRIDIGADEFFTTIRYVKTGAAGVIDGHSWETAFGDLHAALMNAEDGGEVTEIWVAKETYVSGSGGFQLVDGVALYGGFSGNETERQQRDWVANVTELDGQEMNPIVLAPPNAVPETILDGFRITRGSFYSGAGLQIPSGSPTIRNCSFTHNVATGFAATGGALNSGGKPLIVNCIFSENSASSGFGGAAGFSGTGDGGTLVNCTFTENAASAGGAIHSTASHLSLRNCTIANNQADAFGALFVEVGTVDAVNSIIWNNASSPIDGSATVSHSIVQGGWAGDCNLDTDPHLAMGSLALQPDSPAIDAGDSNALPGGIDTDLAGNDRFVNHPCITSACGTGPNPTDLGAYESPVPECCENEDCDDDVFCNGAEVCNPENECQPGLPETCDDSVDCTQDDCDDVYDACRHTPIHNDCNDGLFCNGAEACDEQSGCLPGNNPCGDGVDCTIDSCDETTDTCGHLPEHTNCDDNVLCNGAEVCNPATGCQPGLPETCDDGIDCTQDECDDISDACRHTAISGDCDDDVLCNGAEVCNPATGCQPGLPETCNDGIDCTEDDCDDISDACRHTPINSDCNDGLFCNGAETCDVNGGCQSGAPPCPTGSERYCHEGVGDCISDTVLYVKWNAEGAETGLNWKDAYRYLQDGLALAERSNGIVEEIRVAGSAEGLPSGTYQPDVSFGYGETGDRKASFILLDGVALLGGFLGDPDNPDKRDTAQYVTTLSGDLRDNDDPESPESYEDNSFHVVGGSGTAATAAIDGFIITGGNADGSDALEPPGFGGGMIINTGSPTVTNCVFRGSRAHHGGAIAIFHDRPTITRCRFEDNRAEYVGGAVSNTLGDPVLQDCDFVSNRMIGTEGGGGAFGSVDGDAQVIDCRFTTNTAQTAGGALLAQGGHPSFMDCEFDGNSAAGIGGAVGLASSDALFRRCGFQGNHAEHGGGVVIGAGAPRFEDCDFTGNSAANSSGALYNGGDPSFTNCVFESNRADGGGGGAISTLAGTVKLHGCTFRSNSSISTGGALFVYDPMGPASVFVEEDGDDGNGTEWTTFQNNSADSGGGVYLNTRGEVKLARALFVANEAVGRGGAIASASTDSNMVNCRFFGNHGVTAGGTIYVEGGRMDLMNGLFSGNAVTGAGAVGAGLSINGATVNVINSTFSANAASDGTVVATSGSSAITKFQNSILWGAGGPIQHRGGTLTVQYSDVLGGWPGKGNRNVDPMFVDFDGPQDNPGTEADDLRLQSISPCLDAAANAYIPPDVADLDGDGVFTEATPVDVSGSPRRADAPVADTGSGTAPIVDMGAYERILFLTIEP